MASKQNPFLLWARALRLHQWSKNTLVFVPLLMSGHFHSALAVAQSLTAFLALSLLASATYLLNDYRDLEEDRAHWSKKHRPLASGAISKGQAFTAKIVLSAASLTLALLAGPATLAGLLAYLATTVGYSFKTKQIPLLDVTCIAFLFVLRILIGALAIGVALSPWLAVFAMFFFLSISLAKRYTELTRAAEKNKKFPIRGYVQADIAPILTLGLGSLFAAVMVLVLYLTQEAMPMGLYQTPQYLWAWPMLVWGLLARLWLVTWRGGMEDDPVTYILKDKPSLCLGALMLASFALAMA